jgi:hypothetical protein
MAAYGNFAATIPTEQDLLSNHVGQLIHKKEMKWTGKLVQTILPDDMYIINSGNGINTECGTGWRCAA